ncbi:MAG: bifunctional diaminohydroxyphosphoribosylaminopyrimidine deaminase/5-amino-6-(5-phosphoribosylamino)uracil reductase RibD [Candidatus Dormibacteria bacterium]
MDAALQAAAAVGHRTSPNPMVGAALVRSGEVVAVAAHHRAGAPHAEMNVLAMVDGPATDMELFITLEPCCHEGRTPPCTDAIIAARPQRCVVAMIDPNPKVSGRGVAALREAGIPVDVGVREQDARRLNEFFIKHITTGLPFVTAKFAMSLDGRIATHAGQSHWITSEESRRRVHGLRHAHDAILVGANTVIRDNPNLTTRLEDGGRSPLRIVVDSRMRVGPEARIFHQKVGGVVVATTERARADRVQEFEDRGITVVVLGSDDGRVRLDALLGYLGRREMISLLIEGGSSVHGSAFDGGLVDKVVAFVSPRIIGGFDAPGAVGGRGVEDLADALLLDEVVVETVGTDLVVTGYCRH